MEIGRLVPKFQPKKNPKENRNVPKEDDSDGPKSAHVWDQSGGRAYALNIYPVIREIR